jgi:hypothetical protein
MSSRALIVALVGAAAFVALAAGFVSAWILARPRPA